MTIAAENLREGQQILVRGKISFSRLASLIDGEALARSIDQARKRGQRYPTTKPHTTVNLVDAAVIPANPAAPTIEEQYVHEKTYDIKSGDNAGHRGFGIDNVSAYLPTVLEPDPEAPGAYRQVVLERDLASGLDVTLVIQVFKPQGFEKRGLGLQQVVLHEPVRYYASGMDTSALAARGIVVNGPIRSVSAAEAPVDSTVAAAAFAQEAAISGFPIPANTGADANGLPVPTPGAVGLAPQVAPAAQAFPQAAPSAQGFPQAAPAAPVATQAPVAAPAAPAIPGALPGETTEQTIARLQQQLAETQAAQAASGGESAFGAPAPAAAGGGLTPWDVPGDAPAAFQG